MRGLWKSAVFVLVSHLCRLVKWLAEIASLDVTVERVEGINPETTAVKLAKELMELAEEHDLQGVMADGYGETAVVIWCRSGSEANKLLHIFGLKERTHPTFIPDPHPNEASSA